LLKEDQDILIALQTDAVLGKVPGIFASYLAKIRADGVAKHTDMKQRLDTRAENNSAIVAQDAERRGTERPGYRRTTVSEEIQRRAAGRDRGGAARFLEPIITTRCSPDSLVG
jgi:hypothetical protein